MIFRVKLLILAEILLITIQRPHKTANLEKEELSEALTNLFYNMSAGDVNAGSSTSMPISAEESRKLKHDFARELLEKSKEEMQDPEKLEIASNHMFNSLFENVIFGVALEVEWYYY